MVRALAIDVGTTSVRTALVDESGTVSHAHQQGLTIATPQPGEVELDANEIGRVVLELAARTLGDGGECDVVGVTTQRATTILFDAATGAPVGPALGWQDLRTVIDCLVLQGVGLHLAPNQSATKARWLVERAGRPQSELRMATVETWVTYLLTEGRSFVTDRSNAAVTGLVGVDARQWDPATLELLDLDAGLLANIVDTMGDHGRATALAGSPPITALIGDQPASLFGQSCVHAGAKITFGTGAMLDLVRGGEGPAAMTRFASGCFPVVVASRGGVPTWGVEAIMLSAGACIEWLKDLGLIDEPSECEALAESVSDDGVTFVPALWGLGTPWWDFGARGGFFGLTRGTTRAHLVRAVLVGIAERGADLVDAARAETGDALEEIRVDGGMTANGFLLQCLADASGARVAVSSEREATTRGAGLMALVSSGHLTLDDVEGLWQPARVFHPRTTDPERTTQRARWRSVVARVERTIPDLSSIAF
ncbi:MAG TPA: FGGY family carbohydrate kinase [Acidimicrobiales bacterium]|nr:FGGY family carbohydrate kinase [Acidimicrobiales bacterium]HVB71032.1 FGGY family carbohydrate kinase [Acidimicrobiales bacterium]